MKKFLFIVLIACFTTALLSQTIVSTTPSNRNVILEEYTGKTCGWCPAAHKIAQQLMNANPGRLFSIAIHQGGFAEGIPNYTTPYGDPLMAQAGPPSGYPTGSLNRQRLPGTSGSGQLLYDRGQWTSIANTIKAEASCLNVAAEGTIDWATRKLTLLVEVYYTGSAAQPTNKLTVAMLQNEILGPQSGMRENYPEMVLGTLYRHQHMLRDFITGQWGVDVTPTTTGSFWEDTFEYDIPLHINDIDVALEDLEFLVFVAENEKTIISGAKANITMVNQPANDARIPLLTEIPMYDCSTAARAYVTIKNIGTDPLTSAEFTYTVAGGATNSFVWNKRSIPTMTTDTIHLPDFQIQIGQEQVIQTTLVKANGQAITAAPKAIPITKVVTPGDVGMTFILATDQHANHNTFKIFNPDGTILIQDGPWDPCAWLCVTPRYYNFVPVMEGCHTVVVYDSNGDGVNYDSGAGYIKILNAKGEEIWYNNGVFGYEMGVGVSVDAIATVHKISATAANNGEISPAGERLFYIEGTDAEFTFSPRAGYEVREVQIDGVTVPGTAAITSYTIPAVEKDYKIHVLFRVKQIGIEDANGVAISIAPNPVNDKLYVTGMYEKLEIISITGQVLATAHNEPTVEVSHLAKGIYFVKIQSNGKTGTFKVVK